MARDETKPRRVSADDVLRNAQESASGSMKYLRLPSGVPSWTPKKDQTYELNFFPYVIKTETHPDRRGDKIVPGDLWYKYPYGVHRNIGPSQEDIVCPTYFGKPCPICEHRAQLARNYQENKEEILQIQKKDHCAYIIADPEGDGYAIMAISSFKFGQVLDEELKNSHDSLMFWDVTDAGRTLSVRFKKDSYGGGDFLKASRIDFKPRGFFDEKAVLAGVPCLDDIFLVREYDEIEQLFLQAPSTGNQDGDGGQTPAPGAGASRGSAKVPQNRPVTTSGSAGGQNGTGTTRPAPGAVPEAAKAPGKAAPAAAPAAAPGASKAPGKGKAAPAPAEPAGDEEAAFQIGSEVTFTYNNEPMEGVVIDIDTDADNDTVVTCKRKDGKSFDVDLENVRKKVAAPPAGAKAPGKKAPAKAAPPAEPKDIAPGMTVKDDDGNTGVVTKVKGTSVKFTTAGGDVHSADVSDCTIIEADDADDAEGDAEGDGEVEPGQIGVGSVVAFTVKGKPMQGTIESIADNDDCTIIGTDKKKYLIDVDVLTLVDDGGDGEGDENTDGEDDEDGEDGPHVFTPGDKVTFPDGEGRVVKMHQSGTKARVETSKGGVWVAVEDLVFVPKEQDDD